MGIAGFVLDGGVVFDLEVVGVGSWELGAFSATARSHCCCEALSIFNVDTSSKHRYINKIALSLVVFEGKVL
jgi:hypothetical protein